MADVDWSSDPKEQEARKEQLRKQLGPGGVDHGILDRAGPFVTVPSMIAGALDVPLEAAQRKASEQLEINRLLDIKNNNPETERFLNYIRSLGDNFTYTPAGPELPGPGYSEAPPLRGGAALNQLIADEAAHFKSASPTQPKEYSDFGIPKNMGDYGPTWQLEQHPFFKAAPDYWRAMDRKYGRSAETGRNLDQRIAAGEYDTQPGVPDWGKIETAKQIDEGYASYRSNFNQLNLAKQNQNYPLTDSDGNEVPFLRDYKGYIDHWQKLRQADQKLYKDWWDDLWVMGEGGIHFALGLMGEPPRQPGQSRGDAAFQMGGSMSGGLAGALTAGFTKDPDYYLKVVRKPVILGALFAPAMFRLAGAVAKGTLSKVQKVSLSEHLAKNPRTKKALETTLDLGAKAGDWAPISIAAALGKATGRLVKDAAEPIAAGIKAVGDFDPGTIPGVPKSVIREAGRVGRDFALKGDDVANPQATVSVPGIKRVPGALEPRRVRDIGRKAVKDFAHLFWTGIPTHGAMGAAIGIGVPMAARYFFGAAVKKSPRLRLLNNEIYKATTRRSQGQAESHALGLESQRARRGVAEGMQQAKEGVRQAELEMGRQADPDFVPDPDSMQEVVPYSLREKKGDIPYAAEQAIGETVVDGVLFSVDKEHPFYRTTPEDTPQQRSGEHVPRKGYRIVKEPQRWNNETKQWEGGATKEVHQYPQNVDPYEPSPRAMPDLGVETLKTESGTLQGATPDQVKMDNRQRFSEAVREAANDIHKELESDPGTLSLEATGRLERGERLSRPAIDAERARDQAMITLLRKAEQLVLDRLNPENTAKNVKYQDSFDTAVESLAKEGEVLSRDDGAFSDLDMPVQRDGETAAYRPPVTSAAGVGVEYTANGLAYFVNVLESAAESMAPAIDLANMEKVARTMRVAQKEVGVKAFREIMERVNQNIPSIISDTGQVIIGSPLWDQLTGRRAFGLETPLTSETRSPQYKAKGTGIDSISDKPDQTRVHTMKKPGREGEIQHEMETYEGSPDTLRKPRLNEAERNAARKKYMEMPMETLVAEANKRGLKYDESLSIVPEVRANDGVLTIAPRLKEQSPKAQSDVAPGMDRVAPRTWTLEVAPGEKAKINWRRGDSDLLDQDGSRVKDSAARSRRAARAAPIERKRTETAVRRELVEKLTEMDVKGYDVHPGIEQGLFDPKVTVKDLKAIAKKENIPLKGIKKKDDIAQRILTTRTKRVAGRPAAHNDWGDAPGYNPSRYDAGAREKIKQGKAAQLERRQDFERAALDEMSDVDVVRELNSRGVKLDDAYKDPKVFKDGGKSKRQKTKLNTRKLKAELDKLKTKQDIFNWVEEKNNSRKLDPESYDVEQMAETQGVSPGEISARSEQRQIVVKKRLKRSDLINDIIRQEKENFRSVTSQSNLPSARSLLDRARRDADSKELLSRAEHAWEGSVDQKTATARKKAIERRFGKGNKEETIGDPSGLAAASKLGEYIEAKGELSPGQVKSLNEAVVEAGMKDPKLMSFQKEKPKKVEATTDADAKPAKKKRKFVLKSKRGQAIVKNLTAKAKAGDARSRAILNRIAPTKPKRSKTKKRYKTKGKPKSEQEVYRSFDKEIGEMAKKHIAAKKSGKFKGQQGTQAQDLAARIVSANLPLPLQKKLIGRIRKEIMESAGIDRPYGREGTPVEELQAIEDGTLVTEMLGSGKSASAKKYIATKLTPVIKEFDRRVNVANENIKAFEKTQKERTLSSEEVQSYNRNVKERAQALDEKAVVITEVLTQFVEGVVRAEWLEDFTPLRGTAGNRALTQRGTTRNIPGSKRTSDLGAQIKRRLNALPVLIRNAIKKGRKLPEDLAQALSETTKRQELLDSLDVKDPTGKLRRDYIKNEQNIRLAQSLEIPGIWNESVNGNPIYNMWDRIAKSEWAGALDYVSSQLKKALEESVATKGTEANVYYSVAEGAIRLGQDLTSYRVPLPKRFKREFYLIRDAIKKGGITSFNKARKRLADSDLNPSEQYALSKILDEQEGIQVERAKGIERQIGDTTLTEQDKSYLKQRLIHSGALFSEPGQVPQRSPLIMSLDSGWSKEYTAWVKEFVSDMQRQGKSLGEQRSWTAALMEIWNENGGHGILLDDGFKMKVVEHVVERAQRDYQAAHKTSLPDSEVARLKLASLSWLKSNEVPFRAKPMAAPHSKAKAPTTDKFSVEGGLALRDVPRYLEFFYDAGMEVGGGRFKRTYDLYQIIPEVFGGLKNKERKAHQMGAFKRFHGQYAAGVKMSNLHNLHRGYMSMVDVSYGDTIPEAMSKIAFYNIFDGTPIKSLPNRLLRFMKEFYNKELDMMELKDNYFETYNKDTGAAVTTASVEKVTNKDLSAWMKGDVTYAVKELQRLYRQRMENQIANKHNLKMDELHKIPDLLDDNGNKYKLDISDKELNQIFGKGWQKDKRAKPGSLWMDISNSVDRFSSFFDRPEKDLGGIIQGLWDGTYSTDIKWQQPFETLRVAIQNASREMLGEGEALGPMRSLFDNLDPEGFRTYTQAGEAGIREARLTDLNPTGRKDMQGRPINEGASAPQELIPDVVNDIQWHPEIRQGMAWDAQLTKDMSNLGAAFQSMVKGGITVKSLLTQGGNIAGNLIAISMTTGESVPSIVFRIWATNSLFKTYKENPKWYRENLGSFSKETQRYLKAMDAIDRFTGIDLMDMVTVETQGRGLGDFLSTTKLGDKKAWQKMKESPVYKAGEFYEQLWQDLYQKGDNLPRKAEVLREAIEGYELLDALEPGDHISFQTSQRGDTKLYRDKKGIYRITKRREKQYPSKEDPFVDKTIASWAARRTFGRIFNYRNVPRIVQAARVGKLGGFSALVNPFISFPAIASDIIGVKKGVVANTLLDNMFRNDIKTNSAGAAMKLGKLNASKALRQYAYLTTVQSFAYPHSNDLELMAKSKSQRGTPSLLATESSAYNEARLLSWRNGNPMEMSKLIHDNLFSFEALLAEKMIDWLDSFDKTKQEKIANYDPMTVAATPGQGGGFQEIPTSANAEVDYFMGLVNSGQTLTTQDYLAIGNMTGGFIASIWRDMYDAKTATEKAQILVSKTPQMFLGVNNTQVAKTFLARENLIDPGGYVSPYRNQIKADDDLALAKRRGNWVLSAGEEPYLGGETFAERADKDGYDSQLKYLDTYTASVIARTSARRAMLLDKNQMNPYIKALKDGLRRNLIDNTEYKDPVRNRATADANGLSELRIDHIISVLQEYHQSIRTDLDYRRKLKLDIPFNLDRDFKTEMKSKKMRWDKAERQMGRLGRQRKRDFDASAAREKAAAAARKVK